MMKAIYQDSHGTVSTYKVGEIPKPTPGPGQILVRVHAAALNPIDFFIGSGDLPVLQEEETFPLVAGFDMAGVVESVGEGDVGGWKVGDRVYGDVMLDHNPKKGRGTCAEYCVAHRDLIARVPDGTSMEEAAALPVAALTALQCFEIVNLKKGEKVFVTAGAGGVGIHAIQIAKGLFEVAEVATTASTQKIDFVKQFGADKVVNYKTEDAGVVLRGWADVVLDCTGEFEMEKQVLKSDGRLISIVGDSFAREDIQSMLVKPGRKSLEVLNSLLVEKKLRSVIDTVYSLDDGLDAVKYMSSGHAKGKVIIRTIQ